jgi:hypothetical protein
MAAKVIVSLCQAERILFLKFSTQNANGGRTDIPARFIISTGKQTRICFAPMYRLALVYRRVRQMPSFSTSLS